MNDIPAYPITARTTKEGMTLRDYFAAKAMQGLMFDVQIPDCGYIAKTAYEMADAMMKARETK